MTRSEERLQVSAQAVAIQLLSPVIAGMVDYLLGRSNRKTPSLVDFIRLRSELAHARANLRAKIQDLR